MSNHLTGKVIECYDCKKEASIFFPVVLLSVYPNDASRTHGYNKRLLCVKCYKKLADYATDIAG